MTPSGKLRSWHPLLVLSMALAAASAAQNPRGRRFFQLTLPPGERYFRGENCGTLPTVDESLRRLRSTCSSRSAGCRARREQQRHMGH